MEVEENKTPVEQTAAAGGNAEKKDSVNYDSYQKVLNEKKSTQSKLNESLNELQKLREEKMEREGNQAELLELKNKQINELNEKLNKTEKSFAWSTLTGEIKREALKHGCTDPDKLIRLMDDQDLKSIEVGENFTINKDSLAGVIEKNKKDNFFLFESAKKIAVNGTPVSKIEEKQTDLSKLSMDELKELHKKTYK